MFQLSYEKVLNVLSTSKTSTFYVLKKLFVIMWTLREHYGNVTYECVNVLQHVITFKKQMYNQNVSEKKKHIPWQCINNVYILRTLLKTTLNECSTNVTETVVRFPVSWDCFKHDMT